MRCITKTSTIPQLTVDMPNALAQGHQKPTLLVFLVAPLAGFCIRVLGTFGKQLRAASQYNGYEFNTNRSYVIQVIITKE